METWREARENLRREYFEELLERCRSMTQAAKVAGISRAQLYRLTEGRKPIKTNKGKTYNMTSPVRFTGPSQEVDWEKAPLAKRYRYAGESFGAYKEFREE